MDVPTAETVAEAAMSVACDVNAIRGVYGLKPLRWNWRLWAAAQRMADDIRTRDFFSHVTPDGRNLAERVEPTGYLPNRPDWILAENIGWGTAQLASALGIAGGWFQSAEHRENMLDPKLEEIGVGVAQGSPKPGEEHGTVYVADFGSRGIPRVRAARQRPSRLRHRR